jgi:hypothetical protein
MSAPESAIQRDILDYLGKRGILATRKQSGRVHVGGGWVHQGGAGWPDIIGILADGRFLGIEVKAAEGRIRASQQDFLARCPERALVFFARSIEDVERALSADAAAEELRALREVRG